MNYLTIKQAAELVGKSESSVKRFVSKTKKERPLEYRLKKNFKKEKLPTGHYRTFISEAYLSKHFKIKKETGQKEVQSESLNGSSDLLKKTIEMLENELNEKNNQISSLMERQRESNILIANLQDTSKQIESHQVKKKWWKRN